MRSNPRSLLSSCLLGLTVAACQGGSSSPEGSGEAADIVGAPTCSFTIPTAGLGDNTEALAEAIVETRHITKKNVNKFTPTRRAQVLAAFVHLEMASPEDAVAKAILAADGGEVDLHDLTVIDTGLHADWVSFFAGDTEVGVVFVDNSTEVLAQISDGDIMGCTTSKQCGGHAALGCGDDEFCDFALSCGFGDTPGVCKKRPQACPEVFSPVCGCDGQTHSNSCDAAAAGTDVISEGECQLEGEECGETICDPGMVCCNSLQSICTAPGEVCIF